MIKKIVFKAIAISLGLLVGVFLAECGLRLYLYGPKGFSYSQLNSFKNLGISGYLQKAENDSVLWELQPNLDTLFKFEHFATNSLGMRDREYPVEKPSGVKRIAVIGDSFAMGSGVGQDESYSKLLEKLLNKTNDDLDIEVMNFGVGGYGLRNYDALLRSKVMKFTPDLIIIGFCSGNDIHVPEKAELEGRLVLRPPAEMFYRLHLKRYLAYAKNGFNYIKLSQVPTEKEVLHISTHLKSIKAQCDKRNIPIILAYCAVLPDTLAIQKVRQIAQNNSIDFVDASEGFEGLEIKDITVHPLDGHPNARGHEIYAKNIFRFLQTHQPIPLD